MDQDGLAAALERLRQADVPFRLKHIEDEQQVQIFLSDPSGVGIELNFRGEAPPA